MCGIAGYCSFNLNANNLRNALPHAVSALRNRGPDDQGVWFDDYVGLGHARLSILDLSTHGHQPMISADRRFAMVFNGEVYNFAEIRKDLEALGSKFEGTGDSEVILAALAAWGVSAVKRFIGMFAIALWDTKEKTLLLIRDRLGVKPLYYGWDGQTLWFGSELKALRAFPHWQPEIDRNALGDYFQFGYITAPKSIYTVVRKVTPGHFVTLKSASIPTEEKYWSVLDAVQSPIDTGQGSYEDCLEDLLSDAFNLRMVSDVPVGVFLSGGIDSSLLCALLQKSRKNDPIHTFTIGFNDAASDESLYARKVAEHLGTIHHEQIIEPDDAKEVLPNWAQLYDEPFADSSGIPTYLVSRMASKDVKVVLSADGGDELFSGYGIYNTALSIWAKRNSTNPSLRAFADLVARSPLVKVVDALVDTFPLSPHQYAWLKDKTSWKAQRIQDWVSAETPGALYENLLSFFTQPELTRLLGKEHGKRELSDIYPSTLADQLSLWDLHHYLPGDILTKVDRATMAVSIEGREPLIDHRIVEFAFGLPLDQRRGSLGPKHILKKLLYRHVPRELVDRPKKGFSVPMTKWLKGDLSHLVDEYLDRQRIAKEGLLDPDYVASLVFSFKKGHEKLVKKIWALIAFQMWHEGWK